MLIALQVQGLAVIDSAELKLEPGLNVLSGETGAGKSIVVGALQLALGGRARGDIVRPGVSQAEVEALFDISTDRALCEHLLSSGIHCDGELAVRRIIPDNGRSRAYLNGRLCAINELQALAPRLADVTSQHASVALTDGAEQLRYLDSYAGVERQRQAVGNAVDRIRRLDEQLSQLRSQERERGEREALLRYQRDSIDALDPQENEMVELQQARSRLRNADELARLSNALADCLRRDDGVCDQLARGVAQLGRAAELDGSLTELGAELESCFAQLQDVAQSVADYARGAQADPSRLEEVNERLFELEGLLRQHGPQLSDVLEARARIDDELKSLQQLSTTLPALTKARAEVLAGALDHARELSRQRSRAAKKLAKQAQGYLRELGMPTASVEVMVSPRRTGPIAVAGVSAEAGGFLGKSGLDQVELHIATSRGMELRPLSRIASGGELSRVLLAMKRALGSASSAHHASSGANIPQTSDGVQVSSGGGLLGGSMSGVQVFDEVDAGIGGATADKVGRAVAAIAPYRQVLCITHLAAIAAYADAHFVVDKREQLSLTSTRIRRVDGESRVTELARMLTGRETAKTSLRAARELLAAAVAVSAAAAAA